jgi:cysteine desulfurase
MVFLDAAAGEPMDPAARQAYLAALDDGWSDPDRLYREGRRARMLLDAAREAVAAVLGARADEVSFTASGTAALHIAVLGLAKGRARIGRRIVVGAAEHSAVLHAAEFAGDQVTVGVDRLGRIELDLLERAVGGGGKDSADDGDSGGVALAAVQWANHEVGTIQPLTEAWAVCRRAGVPLLVDAAAGLGRMPVPDTWSVLCGSARKWGGPAGVGVLAVRKGTRFGATGPADERERGRVAGPVNVPAVLAAAAALRAREAEREAVDGRHRALVDRIRSQVAAEVPEVQVVGDPVHRLPHIVTFSCLYASGEALLLELDKAGFAVSSGSSCTASTLTPSHVLEAMGVLSQGNVRVSLPWRVEEAEVDRFLRVLPEIVASVRAQAPNQSPTATPTPARAGVAAKVTSDQPTHTIFGEDVTSTIDALGRKCPIPVIELAKRINTVEIGQVLRVLADDPAARLDIPAWCELRGHTYLRWEPLADGQGAGAGVGAAYFVRRDH